MRAGGCRNPAESPPLPRACDGAWAGPEHLREHLGSSQTDAQLQHTDNQVEGKPGLETTYVKHVSKEKVSSRAGDMLLFCGLSRQSSEVLTILSERPHGVLDLQ